MCSFDLQHVDGGQNRCPSVCSQRFLLPLSVLAGGLKCPVCSFVYGTKWEFNRHLKNKHGLKLVENEGEPKWEVTFESMAFPLTFLNMHAEQACPGTGLWELLLRASGFLVGKLRKLSKSRVIAEG